MALAIDTNNLVHKWIPRLESLLAMATFAKDRYQVHRVHACATVLSQEEAVIREVSICTPSFSVTQEALDWQGQQDVDMVEGDVYKHLIQMGDAPSTSTEKLYSCLSAQRHVASVQSPTFAARVKGQLASTFYRTTFRLCTLEVYGIDCLYPGYHVGATALDALLDDSEVQKVPNEWWESWLEDESPELIWAHPGDRPAVGFAVLWQVQVDVLDMFTHNFAQPSQKRRRLYGPFQQVSPGGEEPPSPRKERKSEAKRYKGVRYRPERKAFVAEMRLPKTRNKVSFGDFKSSKEAARAIDAAFYHYGIRDKVNFADTPQILSTQSKPDGLSDKEALKLVKGHAKMLASFASNLPSSPSSATAVESSTAPALPSRAGNTVVNGLEHSTSTDIQSSSWWSLPFVSYGSADSTCCGESQPPQPPQEFSMEAMAGSPFSQGWLESSTLEPFHDASALSELGEFGEPGQRMDEVVLIVESAINDDDPCVSKSSGYCREQWNGSELYSTRGDDYLRSFVDTSGFEPSACSEFQCPSMEFFCMPSPGPNLFQTDSPPCFQDDVADGLLRQQFSFEDTGIEELMQGMSNFSFFLPQNLSRTLR